MPIATSTQYSLANQTSMRAEQGAPSFSYQISFGKDTPEGRIALIRLRTLANLINLPCRIIRMGPAVSGLFRLWFHYVQRSSLPTLKHPMWQAVIIQAWVLIVAS